MTTAGWHPDPTRDGRMRYWDGTAWTEHVSRDGGTELDPIVGDLPPAPSAPPLTEAPTTTAPSPGGPAAYPPTALGRAGFGAATAGGVLIALTVGGTAVEQEGFGQIEVEGGIWIGIVGAVLCAGAAVAPWVWARLAGLGVASLFWLLGAFAVIGFRTDEDFIPGIDVTLGPAGWMMVAGSLLFLGGTVLALVGLRVPVRAPDPEAWRTSGKGVASLVLGIVGVILPFLSAPAIGLGLLAMDDVRATDGRVGGRGIAIAGVVLGIVALSLWGIGLLLGTLLAQP